LSLPVRVWEVHGKVTVAEVYVNYVSPFEKTTVKWVTNISFFLLDSSPFIAVLILEAYKQHN
jgi:hypothetical protein